MTGKESSFVITIKDLSQVNLETEQSQGGDKEICISINPGTYSSVFVEDRCIIILLYDNGELRISLTSEELSALYHVLSKSVSMNE